MSTLRRTLLIVYVACSLIILVLFACMLLVPAGLPMLDFLRRCTPLAALLVLACIAMLAGLVLTGVVVIVRAYTHTAARLGANETGTISIEKGALVSTAARALGDIDNVAVQDVKVDVIPRGDTAVIDLSVTAVPLGTDSLMALAGRIQGATKRAIETFTEHEVRYVAVNFVESRRLRGDSSSFGAAAEGASRTATAFAGSAFGEEPRDAGSHEPKDTAFGASNPDPSAAGASFGGTAQDKAAGASFGSPLPFGGRDAKEGEAGGSLLDRVKSRISSLRERLEADEEVETQAYVVEEASGGATGAPAASARPDAEVPAPTIEADDQASAFDTEASAARDLVGAGEPAAHCGDDGSSTRTEDDDDSHGRAARA